QKSQPQQELPQQEFDEGVENDTGPSCDEIAAGNDTRASSTAINSTTPSIDQEVNVSVELVENKESDQQATTSTDDDISVVKTLLDFVDITIDESNDLPAHLGVTNIIKSDGNFVKFIRSREDIFRDAIDNQDNMSVKEYCSVMEKDSEYGDLHCIIAYVIISRRPAIVYSKHGDSGFHVYHYNPCQQSAIIQTPIQLHLDTTSKHYEMLLPSNSFATPDLESVDLNNVDCGDQDDGFDDDVNGDKEIEEAEKAEDEGNGEG
ncbi:hypothetical protein HDU76_011906, partial [Blyttiomyces sp. JEL0837]